jgi:hypothetical protein
MLVAAGVRKSVGASLLSTEKQTPSLSSFILSLSNLPLNIQRLYSITCYGYLCNSHQKGGNTQSIPKVIRIIFFCAAQKGQERKAGVEAGGRRTQLYSLTFINWVCAFVAVGTSAKCTVVFVSCHWRKCRGVRSSVTRLSSAPNSENLVLKRCSCWGQLMGMLFCLQPKSSGDTMHSRMEGRGLRMNKVQGVLQLQELKAIWLVWRLFWIGTDVWVRG